MTGDLFYQGIFDRIMDHVGITVHIHFFKNTRSICADSIDTEVEFFCDCFKFFAGRDAMEHLELPVGEFFVNGAFEVIIEF